MISSTLIVGEGVGLDMRLNDYFSLFRDLPKIFVTDCLKMVNHDFSLDEFFWKKMDKKQSLN